MDLTFNVLRAANIERLPLFKNKHGKLAHSQRDGSDCSPAQWLQAVIGELGEYANIRKKYERGDLSHAEYAVLAAKELADVQIYFDILCQRALDQAGSPYGSNDEDYMPHPFGVNLAQAIIDKFNEVSDRVGAAVYIKQDGSDWTPNKENV